MSRSASRRALLLAIAGVAVIHWAMLGLRLSWVSALDGWFWPISGRGPWQPWLLGALIGFATFELLVATSGTTRPLLRIVGLIGLAYALQLGAAWSEGRGIHGLRDRIVSTGHAEFVETAVRERDTPAFLRDYQRRVESGALGQYAPSKPPGQVYLYMATDFFSRHFARAKTHEAEVNALRDVATWWWPLFAALPVAPIYGLGVVLARGKEPKARDDDRRIALAAAALYATLPATCLITLHTDQVFYPLFVTLAALLAAVAGKSPRLVWSFAAGVAYAGALFCSFGLVGALPIMAACIVAAEPIGQGAPLKKRLARLALWALGLLAVYAALRWLGGYDWLEGRRYAHEHHIKWKGWDERRATFVHFALVDALDFGVWIGAPLSLAAVLASLGSLADLRASLRSALSTLTLALVACFAGLLMYGRTKGETGRLWLFLAPFVCLSVAAWMHRHVSARRSDVRVLLGLQLVSVYFIKRFMDFW